MYFMRLKKVEVFLCYFDYNPVHVQCSLVPRPTGNEAMYNACTCMLACTMYMYIYLLIYVYNIM